jgi:hypothetical protein
MERNTLYTAKDCSTTGLDCGIQGKVVVLNQDTPERQLYFCLCGNGWWPRKRLRPKKENTAANMP